MSEDEVDVTVNYWCRIVGKYIVMYSKRKGLNVVFVRLVLTVLQTQYCTVKILTNLSSFLQFD